MKFDRMNSNKEGLHHAHHRRTRRDRRRRRPRRAHRRDRPCSPRRPHAGGRAPHGPLPVPPRDRHQPPNDGTHARLGARERDPFRRDRRKPHRVGRPHPRVDRGRRDLDGLPDGRGRRLDQPDLGRDRPARPPRAGAHGSPALAARSLDPARRRADRPRPRRRRHHRDPPRARRDVDRSGRLRHRSRRRPQRRARPRRDHDGRTGRPRRLSRHALPGAAGRRGRRTSARALHAHAPGTAVGVPPDRPSRPLGLLADVGPDARDACRLPARAPRRTHPRGGRRTRPRTRDRLDGRLHVRRPDRRPVSRAPRVPRRRRRPPHDPTRRRRHEHGDPRRVRPGLEARVGAALVGRRVVARLVRGRAPAGRPAEHDALGGAVGRARRLAGLPRRHRRPDPARVASRRAHLHARPARRGADRARGPEGTRARSSTGTTSRSQCDSSTGRPPTSSGSAPTGSCWCGPTGCRSHGGSHRPTPHPSRRPCPKSSVERPDGSSLARRDAFAARSSPRSPTALSARRRARPVATATRRAGPRRTSTTPCRIAQPITASRWARS